MKKMFAWYIVIGLMFSPLIYSNNAQKYREGTSAYRWGQAMGQSFYWPSYLFSIEPVVDGSSVESFNISIGNILKYRDEKLFTGKRTNTHAFLILKSINSCLIKDGLLVNSNQLNSYKRVFENEVTNKYLDDIRKKVMDRFDGYDFADIVEEVEECKI